MQASSVRNPIPDEPVRGHSSWWVRLFTRILSIPGIPWVMFVLAILATVVVCQVAWEGHQERQEIKFEADTTVLRNAMLERLQRYALVVQGLGGLFAASESVDAGEFRSYVDSLDMENGYPGILAVGYVEWVDHARREAFLLDMGADTGKSDASFRIWPSGDRPDYLVLRLLEPLDTNRLALGFDLGSETARRHAAMSARDSGEATLTSKVELVQAVGTPGGILFQPVYASESIPATVSERRALLRGWISTAFLVGDMMEGVQQLTKSNLDYELFDGTTPSPDKLLCSSLPEEEPLTSGKDMTRSSTMNVFGQPWTLRVRCATGAAGPAEVMPVGLLAGGGILMSLLIFGITHSMATTSGRAVTLATGMTGELRRQEKALRMSEERLALVIEGSNDGIWDWNVITNDVYFSRRWKGMLGYEDHEIENVFSSWKKLLHPDERERVLGVLDSYIAGNGSSYQLEHRLRQKDGSYRSILARGVVSRDSEGKPVRMAGSHFDLTDLKKAEIDLRETNEELKSSQARLEAALVEVRTSHEELKETQLELIQAAKLESVGSLAAGIAHEVKNPLQILMMGLDFLDYRIDDADEVTSGTLSDMRDAVLRADAITKELLNLSAASEFAPVPSDLGVVLERSLWLMRSDITEAKVTVVKELSDDLPAALLDRQKIQQVLINLIRNALQAMGEGGTLAVSTASGHLGQFLPSRGGVSSPLSRDDEVVILRVRDTGPGIMDDQLPRIFDPFFTTKSVGTGTGLGLSVVRKIINFHDGLVDAANVPGGGLELTLAFAVVPESSDVSLPEVTLAPESPATK